jgi:hypothetical protein
MNQLTLYKTTLVLKIKYYNMIMTHIYLFINNSETYKYV